MTQRPFLTLVICTLAMLAPEPGAAGQAKLSEAQQQAVKQVRARLQELKAPEAHVEALTDKAVAESFPGQTFVTVRFRLWPVAVAPPESLRSQNLFVVSKDGKSRHLTSSKELEQFFKANLGVVKREPAADQALSAWLLLTKEFVQDGFYTFVLSKDRKWKDSVEGTINVWGAIEVKPEGGNKGMITAQLSFDREGKLTQATEQNKVVRGMRPRCQATRLLDPDPVIRAICEDSLLVLGKAAREYLREQRATAGPELRQAIDRIWQRILEEGR
ncbi:MAG: hypothetical protein L0Z62_21730 [Gemmataceae bacterium]|nr:hypothetical protein [Gemmataceae bacterium]